MRRFLITLGFMTRIPVPQNLDYQEKDLEKGIVYFPVIGLLLGAGAALVYSGSRLVLPEQIAVVLAMLANLFLTGAFHLDGLCDTADGIYSARKPDRMLEIMKDSRLGTNGAVALVADLVLKYLGIMALPCPWIGLLLLPVMGKMVQGILGYHAVYPRKEGLGLFVGTVELARSLFCFGIGCVLLFAGFGIQGISVSIGLLLVTLWFKRYISHKIGGITGDVMGAASELCEILGLLLLLCRD